MKPIGIFRHYPTEGPGYFATFLERNVIPWQLIAIDRGDVVPARPNDFSGLTFMGGPMSVNDDLPWITEVLHLIRAAVAADVPVLGHCLGGQLMAKALGGTVGRNPVKEIGWGELQVTGDATATAWFAHTAPRFQGFHWHGETFSLPPGATRLLSSAYCTNQAFAMGKHLALQCHVEMTPDLIRDWCRTGHREIAANAGPSVQTAEQMLADLDTRLPELHRIADGLYEHWVKGLAA